MKNHTRSFIQLLINILNLESWQNLDAFALVVEAVQRTEYAVRDEGVKTRNMTAEQFSNLIAAINAGNASIIGAINGKDGGGFDDSRMVNATNEVRDEVKKMNDRFDAAKDALDGIGGDMEGEGNKVRGAADEAGGAVGNALAMQLGESGNFVSAVPSDSVKVGRHYITFNPFSAYSPVSWLGDFLRALRSVMLWSIVAGFLILVIKQVWQMVGDIMKTGKHVSNAAIVAAPGALGTVGPVLGASLAAVGLVVMIVVVLVIPVIIVGFIDFSMGKMGGSAGIVSASAISFISDAAGRHGVIAQGLWYADQIVPLSLCFTVPVYYILVSKFVIPSTFVAQIILRFFPL